MTPPSPEDLSRRDELILKSAGEGIYGLDSEGRTTFVNPAAASMLGWPEHELIGRSQHDVIHHTRPDGTPYDAVDCPIYSAFSDSAVHRVDDEVFWRKDGTSFAVDSDRLVTNAHVIDAVLELAGQFDPSVKFAVVQHETGTYFLIERM